jgi:hypothetical protein
LSFDGSGLTLECFEGSDRSETVRFDTNYDSLANGEFSDSSESFSNAIYVGGKGQNDDRDIYEGENGTPSGLDRFESWDNQSSMTTEAEYEAEAISMLTQYGQTIQMSGNGLAKCPYIYKEQYDVGDLITVAFSGKSAVVQILSVTEHWAWGSYDIQFSFGKPQNNLADQLQLMLRQIQKASEKANSTDSVRWYTIPTDTTMPKADVTYNTIGFVGNIGSGATFTLYLDNEKTGAKTYHVWFKQLEGNGKLTLTTGKSGAVNLEFGGGTYVAIISVDEAGNIVNVASTPTNIISSGNSQPATSSGVAGALSGKVNTDTYTDTNLNTLINTGLYSVGWLGQSWENLNFPIKNFGTVLVGTSPSGNLLQMFMPDGTQVVYVRNCTTNIWSSWKKVSLETDFGQWETVAILGNNGTSFAKGLSTPNGKYLYLRLSGLSSGTYNNGDVLFTLPEGWRPNQDPTRVIIGIDTSTDRISAGLDIHSYGAVNVYFQGHTPFSGQSVTVSGFYGDIFLFIG